MPKQTDSYLTSPNSYCPVLINRMLKLDTDKIYNFGNSIKTSKDGGLLRIRATETGNRIKTQKCNKINLFLHDLSNNNYKAVDI